MESNAFILLGIFGVALLLSAFVIVYVHDPRKLPFFTAIDPITHMPLYRAREEAKVIAKYVAITGGIILIGSLAGLLACEFSASSLLSQDSPHQLPARCLISADAVGEFDFLHDLKKPCPPRYAIFLNPS